MLKYFQAILTTVIGVLSFAPQAVSAQTVWAQGNRSVTYSDSPIIGDGVNRVTEVFNATQGGDPPATLIEPAEIGENGKYVRADWISSANIYRLDQGEAKFRIACNYAKSGTFDAIVFPGLPTAGHPHSFAGNVMVNQNGDYAQLRNNPKSTCDGGPLWSQGYWAPQLLYERTPGVKVEVLPDNHTFYYREDYARTQYLIRLLRGTAFIGGVNPADRLNVAGLAEIPNGAGWDKTKRYNGWGGWQCAKVANSDGAVTNVYPAGGSTADINPDTGLPRQLLNTNGSDPWAGLCEPGSGYKLILVANIDGPKCWDGYTLKGDGRGQWRYAIRKADGSVEDGCPDYSWRVPVFEDKIQYSNYGAAWRAKLSLASDMANPPGSTMHIDWMYGSDDYVFRRAMDMCIGVSINGATGHPLTCGNGTFSDTERLKGNNEAPPVAGLSNNPIVSLGFKSAGPRKLQYGPVPPGTKVSAHATHH